MRKHFEPIISKGDTTTVIETKLSDFVRSVVSGVAAPRPQNSAILGWHDLILNHALGTDSVLILRKNGAEEDLSEIRGRIYADPITAKFLVRSDNSPGIWIYNRAFYSDCSPPERFQSLLEEKAFAMADRFSDDEKTLLREGKLDWASYLQQDNASYRLLWDANWKLCHLLPCSPNGGKVKDIFLERLYDTDRKCALAMSFVRNLSLFNLVPGPSPRHYDVTLDGQRPYRNDLGEDQAYLDWTIFLLATEIYDRETADAFSTFLRSFGCRDVFQPAHDPVVAIRRKSRAEVATPCTSSAARGIDARLREDRNGGTPEALPSSISELVFDAREGDLVVLVRPPGKGEGYPNVWDGSRLSILATHKKIIDRIEDAQQRGRERIFVQIAPKGAGERRVVGSGIVAGIERNGSDFLVHFSGWLAPSVSKPPGRSYGASYYWVGATGKAGSQS